MGFKYVIGRFAIRVVLFGVGNIKVSMIGQIDPQARFLVCNHCSFFDPLIMLLFAHITPVMKKELNIPVVRPMLMNTNPIFIDRKEAHGQTNLILEKAKDVAHYDPILIYPEGTITDCKTLLKFHHSAFLTDLKVQPLTLRYNMPLVPPGWNSPNWHMNSFLEFLFCQFSLPLLCSITVECLKPVTKSVEGKGDPDKFAKYTQLLIANKLMIPAISRSSTEIFHAKKAAKPVQSEVIDQRKSKTE